MNNRQRFEEAYDWAVAEWEKPNWPADLSPYMKATVFAPYSVSAREETEEWLKENIDTLSDAGKARVLTVLYGQKQPGRRGQWENKRRRWKIQGMARGLIYRFGFQATRDRNKVEDGRGEECAASIIANICDMSEFTINDIIANLQE